LVLGLASCQTDPEVVNPAVDAEVDFQLSVAAPELATRAGENGAADTQKAYDSAFGAIDYLQTTTEADAYRVDWKEVDLRYTLEVYDVKDGAVVGTTPVKDRQVIIKDSYEPVVFDLRLVPNRDYRFVVFADFVAEGGAALGATDQLSVAGIRHKIGATLADIEVINESINDEVGDAYFATKDIKVTNSAAQDIVLRRPYGKVRVIATDLAELNLNVHPYTVEIAYDAYNCNKFDAVTGVIKGQSATAKYTTTFINKVRDNMANHIYNAGYDAKTAPAVNGTERHTHITLATDYILALPEGQTPIHFTMVVKDEAGVVIKETAFTTDIPVERNKLTTVIGNVLTTATEIEVRIDDNFAGEYVENMVFVNTAKELQEALDNYVNGQTIILDADIKGNVTVDQVEGKDYVIDGNGYNYDGTIYIDGNSRNDGTETVIIRNFNFATDSSDINFIEQNSTNGAVRYAHNVTIENCSFRATGVNVVAVKIRQGYNITIKNCVADGVTRANDSGMHSLGQFYGCTGITIDGVNFNNAGEGGVSFGTSTNVVVKNSTFVTGYYGVRADASVETTLKLENVNITAMVPVIARQCTADYAIELTGENTMEAPGYDIVFTQGGDKAAFVAPTSNFSVTGADEFIVFPSDEMPLYAYNAAGLQYLLDNAVDGDTVKIVADIEGDVTVSQKADVKIAIEGNNHKYAGVIVVDGKSATYTTAGVTIKNLNFEAETISADACIRLGNGTNATRYTCNVTVEDCTFNVPGAVAVKSYTGGDKNLTIKRCTATGLHSLSQLKNVEGVTIEDVTVDGGRGVSFGVSSNIVVKNSTFVAESYGLRVDATAEATLAIENVNITAKLPVVARKTSKNYTINFTGENNLVAGGYQVVFTTGDDEATFVAPAEYTLTGADNFKVFPRDAADTVNAYVYNVDEFKKALESKKTNIFLQSGVFEGEFTINYDNVTIYGDEATIKGRVEAINATAKFEGVKFDYNDSSVKEFSGNIVGNPKGHPAIVGVYGGTADTVTFENCEFICKSGYNTANAPGAITHYGGIKLTLKDCTIDCNGNPIYAKTNIEMTGCTVKMYGNNAVLSLNYSNEGRTVIFKNNIVENKSTNGAQTYAMQFLSTNGKAYKDMYFDVQGNTVDVLFSRGSGYTFANATYANGSATL